MPPVGLVDVPLQIVVSDLADGDVVTVNIDGEDHWVTADADGRAAVPNISVSVIGPIVVVATIGGSSA